MCACARAGARVRKHVRARVRARACVRVLSRRPWNRETRDPCEKKWVTRRKEGDGGRGEGGGQNKLRKKRLANVSKLLQNGGETCAICLETLLAPGLRCQRLGCGHTYQRWHTRLYGPCPSNPQSHSALAFDPPHVRSKPYLRRNRGERPLPYDPFTPRAPVMWKETPISNRECRIRFHFERRMTIQSL